MGDDTKKLILYIISNLKIIELMQHTWLLQVQHIEAINQLEKTRNLLRVQVIIFFSCESRLYIYSEQFFFASSSNSLCKAIFSLDYLYDKYEAYETMF